MMYECIHCHKPVKTTLIGDYGTRWIHTNGEFECEPTYAAPNFDRPVGP